MNYPGIILSGLHTNGVFDCFCQAKQSGVFVVMAYNGNTC